MKTDIEIAQECQMHPIIEIARQAGLMEEELECYGSYKAKISDSCMRRLENETDGKLVLVTAINPTPAGEGKTTVTVGLGQALHRIGKRAIIALREPSLGPVFGLKGGAAGGGYAQVVPMEDINLHFTGDIHAITTANNLLAALLDNHLQQGNVLDIDPRSVVWKRALDMNDRALRHIVIGMGGKANGVVREDSFLITVASEIMAVLCLAADLADLKKRLGRIIVAYNHSGAPVTAADLHAVGAMAAVLKDALKPNLVQTLEHTPCLMHGGPFANIAHGCNSVRATRLGLKLADYCVTEAGFGADLGGEKFIDIKCRMAGLHPSAVVIVATVQALRYNGGKTGKGTWKEAAPEALKHGLPNLGKHVENMKKTGVPVVVALNRFATDTAEEIQMIQDYCAGLGVDCIPTEVFAKGGEGGEALAKKVVELTQGETPELNYFYPLDLPVEDKIRRIVQEVYGGVDVVFSTAAQRTLKQVRDLGLDGLPVCMAKTQYSLTDDPAQLARPEGFTVHVSEIRISAGAGFLVAVTGSIMTMPGLPKVPAADGIDVTDDGKITGLF